MSTAFSFNLSCFFTTSVRFFISTSLFNGKVALVTFSKSSIVTVWNIYKNNIDEKPLEPNFPNIYEKVARSEKKQKNDLWLKNSNM